MTKNEFGIYNMIKTGLSVNDPRSPTDVLREARALGNSIGVDKTRVAEIFGAVQEGVTLGDPPLD
jgi:hypothetical protein